MKRTTYIFIGVFLGGMLLILLNIFYFNNELIVVERPSAYTVNVPEETTEIDMTGIHTLKFTGDCPDDFILNQGTIKIFQPEQKSAGKIVLPLAEYIKAREVDGTLVVEFDFESMPLTDEQRAGNIYIGSFDLLVEVPGSLVQIENELATNILSVKEIKSDSLAISSQTTVFIDGGEIGSLKLSGSNVSFLIYNTAVTKMHIDLDAVRSFELVNSVVRTQYLSGSRNSHQWSSCSGQVEDIIWTPKNDDAKLMLNFDRAAEISIHTGK